jgi:hypothetical protein
MSGWMIKWLGGSVAECMDELTNWWVGGLMDGCMDGWMI